MLVSLDMETLFSGYQPPETAEGDIRTSQLRRIDPKITKDILAIAYDQSRPFDERLLAIADFFRPDQRTYTSATAKNGEVSVTCDVYPLDQLAVARESLSGTPVTSSIAPWTQQHIAQNEVLRSLFPEKMEYDENAEAFWHDCGTLSPGTPEFKKVEGRVVLFNAVSALLLRQGVERGISSDNFCRWKFLGTIATWRSKITRRSKM